MCLNFSSQLFSLLLPSYVKMNQGPLGNKVYNDCQEKFCRLPKKCDFLNGEFRKDKLMKHKNASDRLQNETGFLYQ